ncbi:hypothetical protein [Streptacidiphilus rugosus]|uniref:hypothetical protein n=1 Tax=Streptacidiphilus rugosus TaxID=405783 RepID=UPI00056AD668|nr:hypothetical protein [Streptacidiphilus rugosus]
MTDQSYEQDSLARELAELPPVPAPLGTVDVNRAVHDGRARIRRRRGATAAAAAGLVAVAVLGLLVGGVGGSDSSLPVEVTSSRPTVDPHDPLTLSAGFGWLPPGFTKVVRSRGNGQEYFGAYVPDPHSSLAVADVLVSFETGSPVLPKTATSAPDVNGRPGYWITASKPVSPNRALVLLWQAADGRWVRMEARSMPGTDPKRDLLRTAAGFDVREVSVPLPFHVSNTESGLTVDNIQMTTTDSGAKWMVTASFKKGNYDVGLLVGPANAYDASNFSGLVNCAIHAGIKACTFGGELAYRAEPVPSDAAWVKRFMSLADVTLLDTDARHWTTDVLR